MKKNSRQKYMLTTLDLSKLTERTTGEVKNGLRGRNSLLHCRETN